MLMHQGGGVVELAAELAKLSRISKSYHASYTIDIDISSSTARLRHRTHHIKQNKPSIILHRVSTKYRQKVATKAVRVRRGGSNESASVPYTQAPFCSDLPHGVACCPRTEV
jgi:hypothetical protein